MIMSRQQASRRPPMTVISALVPPVAIGVFVMYSSWPVMRGTIRLWNSQDTDDRAFIPIGILLFLFLFLAAVAFLRGAYSMYKYGRTSSVAYVTGSAITIAGLILVRALQDGSAENIADAMIIIVVLITSTGIMLALSRTPSFKQWCAAKQQEYQK
jgi:hypothetical protein